MLHLHHPLPGSLAQHQVLQIASIHQAELIQFDRPSISFRFVHCFVRRLPPPFLTGLVDRLTFNDVLTFNNGGYSRKFFEHAHFRGYTRLPCLCNLAFPILTKALIVDV